MAFARGSWRCDLKGCGGEAQYAFRIHATTPGNRKDRIQRYSGTVRLCLSCINDIKAGKVPANITAAIQEAIKKVQGER